MDDCFGADLSNLTLFLTAENDGRIGASIDDQMIFKYTGLIAGVMAMALFAYVNRFSSFTESSGRA